MSKSYGGKHKPAGWGSPADLPLSGDTQVTPGGIYIGGEFFAHDYLNPEGMKRLAELEAERDRFKKEASRAAKDAARFKEENGRLKAQAKERAEAHPLTTVTRTSPRYFLTGKGWSWHEYDAAKGEFVDTGKPVGRRGSGFPPDAVCEKCGRS